MKVLSHYCVSIAAKLGWLHEVKPELLELYFQAEERSVLEEKRLRRRDAGKVLLRAISAFQFLLSDKQAREILHVALSDLRRDARDAKRKRYNPQYIRFFILWHGVSLIVRLSIASNLPTTKNFWPAAIIRKFLIRK